MIKYTNSKDLIKDLRAGKLKGQKFWLDERNNQPLTLKDINKQMKSIIKLMKIAKAVGRKEILQNNNKIIKWLQEIIWCNGHDKAWIEKTIEKLKEVGK